MPLPPKVPFPLAETYLLCGVTFCSILTVGNRHCPQPRKVRVASVPLTARSSITREVGGPAALASRRQPPHTGLARKQSSPLLLGKLLAPWRAPQAADNEKMAAASAEGERGGDSSKAREGPRSQTPSSIWPAVGLQ